MLKVCHIAPFYGEQYGGPERYVNTISPHQKKAGIDVTILTTTQSRKKAGISEINGIKQVKIYSLKDIWHINPVSFILNYLRKSKFDIIHIHSYLYFISNQGVLFGKIKKIPTLLHLHGGIGLPPYQASTLKITTKAFYDKTLGRLTISHANRIASVSKSDLRKVKIYYSVPEYRLIYIPNTINFKLFSNNHYYDLKDNDGTFSVLYIGDIEPWKGIGFLEEWIRKRRNNLNNKLNFRFVGQGSLSPRLKTLEKLCKNSNITVDYLGSKPHKEIPRILAESQALILPSYWEGSPTVLLEAMAAKVPVITTPVGDIPQIIQNRKNGFLINHDFKSLENSIEFLINNPNRTKRIVIKAYKTIARSFSSTIINRNLLKIYMHLVN
ncbi:MAG: glycosyltransferase family 4 protein [Promethearchaeota archaeon]